MSVIYYYTSTQFNFSGEQWQSFRSLSCSVADFSFIWHLLFDAVRASENIVCILIVGLQYYEAGQNVRISWTKV